MRTSAYIAVILVAPVLIAGPAVAKGVFSLKGGESVDVGDVYAVVNCKSMLKGDPTVEIMEGPPDVTVSIRKQDIKPRGKGCSKPVPGGIIVITAPKEVKARSEGKLTVRLKVPTVDGERQSSRDYDVKLFP